MSRHLKSPRIQQGTATDPAISATVQSLLSKVQEGGDKAVRELSIRFDGLEEATKYLTRPHLLRSAYRRAFQTYQDELRRGCEAQKVDYVLADTSQPLAALLAPWLARRLRFRRM